MKKWVIVVLVVLAVAAGWKEMNRGGGMASSDGMLVNTLPKTSPLYAQQQEFIDRFNADPQLRERFAGDFTSKGLYSEMSTALARGARSLDGPSLVAVTRAMSAAIPRLPKHSCAKLVRQRDDFDMELSRDMDDALSRLPAVHHRNLWEFYLRALRAEIDNLPEKPRNAEAERHAMEYLAGNYTGQFAERMAGVMQNPGAASDEDACWAIGTLTHGAAQLPPQSAEAMSRMIWGGR